MIVLQNELGTVGKFECPTVEVMREKLSKPVVVNFKGIPYTFSSYDNSTKSFYFEQSCSYDMVEFDNCVRVK